jgi:alpha-ketoglutarate-dependent 2,4-dichlorophenoxyacetate dioxygenase
MSLVIKPLHPSFAVEIFGADLREPPSRTLVERIEAEMAKHAVVVVRDQAITDEQHVTFSRAFGPLELPPRLGSGGRSRLRPELFDASNLDDDGKLLAESSLRRSYNRANELFHTDSSFHDMPTKWSLLYAYVVPAAGGDTEFVDTRAVYDDLPRETKSKIEGLQAEHYLWHSRERAGFKQVTDEMRRAMPPVRHPIVRTSAGNRRALYLGAHASHIVGWPIDEGRKLIEELNAVAAQPKYIYSHRWLNGDLLIWDNRCTYHRAGAFEGLRLPRDLRRTTINEHGPEQAATDRGRSAA